MTPRETQIRELLEAAIQADGLRVAAEAAREAARDSHEKSVERARNAVIALQSVLGQSVIRYGDKLVSISCNELRVVPIEAIPLVVPTSAPVPKAEEKPPAKASVPLTKTGPVPTLGKK